MTTSLGNFPAALSIGHTVRVEAIRVDRNRVKPGLVISPTGRALRTLLSKTTKREPSHEGNLKTCK